jgi:hypothetical protein
LPSHSVGPREPALNALPSAAPRPISPLHGRFAIGGLTAAVALSVDLHLRLAGQVSPVWQTLSEYVYGRLGPHSSAAPLFGAMCLALVTGSVALLTGIARSGRAGSGPVLGLLGVWCAGLVVCALVPVDPAGAARSLNGQVHNYAALTAFLALPGAAWTLTRRSSAHCPWEPRRSTIRRLAVASLLGVAVLLGSFLWQLGATPGHPELTMGLFERALFTIDLALLLTLVRPLLRPVSGAPR